MSVRTLSVWRTKLQSGTDQSNYVELFTREECRQCINRRIPVNDQTLLDPLLMLPICCRAHPQDAPAYGKLRVERMNARLMGARSKKAKEAKEAEEKQ